MYIYTWTTITGIPTNHHFTGFYPLVICYPLLCEIRAIFTSKPLNYHRVDHGYHGNQNDSNNDALSFQYGI